MTKRSQGEAEHGECIKVIIGKGLCIHHARLAPIGPERGVYQGFAEHGVYQEFAEHGVYKAID